MPIRFRYDAAAVVPPSNETTRKYGQSLVLQGRQQNYNERQLGYDRLFTLGRDQQQRQQNFMEDARRQSTGMIMDDIENGMYDPVTANKLRQNLVQEAEALGNPNLDPTQRATALQKFAAERALHVANRLEKPARPNAQELHDQSVVIENGVRGQRNAKGEFVPFPQQQQQPRSFQDYYKDPENKGQFKKDFRDTQRALEANKADDAAEITDADVLEQMQKEYAFEQQALGTAPSAAPPAKPTGPSVTRTGQSPSSRDIALAPAHPDYQASPTPTGQKDAQGYVIMSDGSRVHPAEVKFAMKGAQSDFYRTLNPDGSQIASDGTAKVMLEGQGVGVQGNPWEKVVSQAEQRVPQGYLTGLQSAAQAPGMYMQDESGNYANPPAEQARLQAAAQQRYLQDQGPSMGQYTDVLNQRADALSANLAGSDGRINSTVPYGARNAYSPLGGEGAVEQQRSLVSGVPSEEELLAQNRADLDSMYGTMDANNAAMQGRAENTITDPKQMRKDMQKTTDAYHIYKRKGGTMDFRKWAVVHNETNGMTPDVKAQFANNYPGIWDQLKVDPASTDVGSVDSSKAKNTSKDKVAKRRAGLLALTGQQPDAPVPQAVPANQASPQSPPTQAPAQADSSQPYVSPTLRNDWNGIKPPTQGKYGYGTSSAAYYNAPQSPAASAPAQAGASQAGTSPDFGSLLANAEDDADRGVISSLQGIYASQPPEVQSAITSFLSPSSDEEAAQALAYLKEKGIFSLLRIANRWQKGKD